MSGGSCPFPHPTPSCLVAGWGAFSPEDTLHASSTKLRRRILATGRRCSSEGFRMSGQDGGGPWHVGLPGPGVPSLQGVGRGADSASPPPLALPCLSQV